MDAVAKTKCGKVTGMEDVHVEMKKKNMKSCGYMVREGSKL